MKTQGSTLFLCALANGNSADNVNKNIAMKQILLILGMWLPLMVMAQNKVAIYVAYAEDIDDATKRTFIEEMVININKTSDYTAIDRTSDFLQQLNNENGYSNKVDDQKICSLGKKMGVNYVCEVNIIPDEESYYLIVRLIDVETTKSKTATMTSSLSNSEEIVSATKEIVNKLLPQASIENFSIKCTHTVVLPK